MSCAEIKMAGSEIHETLYEEAGLWLAADCKVELNIAGTWVSVERMISDNGGIVKCHTEMGALWFPLEELRGIREAAIPAIPAIPGTQY
jgi:hypothetical protein